MFYILIIIAIILLILEMATISTYFIWVSIGFFAAAICAIFTDNLIVITIIGLLATICSVLLLKSKYVALILPKKRTKTAYEQNIGKQAVMLDSYDADGVSVGQAKIEGQEWTAICKQANTHFETGELVNVIAIEGVKLVIEKK